MRIRHSLLCLFVSISFSALPQVKGDDTYHYTVDLTKVSGDKVMVILQPPTFTEDVEVFNLPKIIPGTYAIEDYGRYVVDLQSLDAKGKNLPIEKLNTNSWRLSDAKSIAKITYWIEDSFDSKNDDPDIFWPAKTNIQEGKNFLVNAGGFFGYFDGMKKIPFEITYIRSSNLYGVTGLVAQSSDEVIPKSIKKKSKDQKMDIFHTSDYDQLVDSPLMYTAPDTAIVHVANADVLIGCYSPNHMITAKEIAASIKEVLNAQSDFLGGQLPVNKYAFIFYFTDQPVIRYGALEHSYSSMYYMPEETIEQMNQQLRDFAAHEFFHIITPLTVHSKEIDSFDFNDPKMSRHLWMYEGVTEYFAGLVQVKNELINPEEYLNMIREKMINADSYRDDLPFTELSEFTIDKYEDQYDNVYQKGALIGLCLDLKLLKLSDGKYGLRNLMLDLSKKFGKSKPFNDAELFDIITEMTYPEIREFFRRYVEGPEPLPLKETFESVGLTYDSMSVFDDYSMGLNDESIDVNEIDGKLKLVISDTDKLDEMGKRLGFKTGDILTKINDKTIPDVGPDLGPFIQEEVQSLPTLDTLSFTLLRPKEGGKPEETRLTTKVEKVTVTAPHLIRFMKEPSPEELTLLRAWLAK